MLRQFINDLHPFLLLEKAERLAFRSFLGEFGNLVAWNGIDGL